MFGPNTDINRAGFAETNLIYFLLSRADTADE